MTLNTLLCYICFNSNSNNKSYSITTQIIGTKEFLEGVKQYLLQNGLESISLKEIDEETESNTWVLSIFNMLDILKFKELIYDNYFKEYPDGDLYLQRKWNKFLEIQQYVDNNKEKIAKLIKLRYIKKIEIVEKIRDMYLNKKFSMLEISNIFKVGKTAIKYLFINNNIPIRKRN